MNETKKAITINAEAIRLLDDAELSTASGGRLWPPNVRLKPGAERLKSAVIRPRKQST